MFLLPTPVHFMQIPQLSFARRLELGSGHISNMTWHGIRLGTPAQELDPVVTVFCCLASLIVSTCYVCGALLEHCRS